MVEMKIDCIHQRVGGGGGGTARASGFRSAYADIESCTFHRDSYKGVKFVVARLKNKFKFVRVVNPVEYFIVPGDLDINAISKIFREHGVQAFEE